MKKVLPFIFVVFFFVNGIPGKSMAQDFSRNSIYVEIGGNGLLYSINYDHLFTEHVGGRIGVMVFSGQSDEPTDDTITFALIPVMANYLIGSGSHHIELGAGLLFGIVSADLEDYDNIAGGGISGITTTIGYRYQPVDGGFLFRMGLTPFYSANEIQLWGGLSLGYSF